VFHFIVTSGSGTWDGTPYVFDISRVIREYTDDAFKQKYKDLDENIIPELQSLPAIFAYEDEANCDARVGYITRIRNRNNQIQITYDFFPELPAIPPNVISKLSWELEIGNYEMNRTHWAIKSADLFELLYEAKLITKEQATISSAQLNKTDKTSSNSKTINQIPEMPAEDKRNSGLIMLMQLAQVYYKLLECSTSVSNWCVSLDLELNESYIWTINGIKNLLKNHSDLKDFPFQFEPLFSDLYPTTIKDVDWADDVAPEADQFLSTVQKYIANKGVYEPEKNSPAWIFIELFKPSINLAIERANAYNKKMAQFIQTRLTTKSSNNTTNSEKPSASKSTPNASNEMKSSQRDKVFISYSHKDTKILNELLAHLKPFERLKNASIWSDLQINPGSKWFDEIKRALALTKVAVLLVTKDFLASDFIHHNELCPLLQTEKECGIKILWVLVRDCNWMKTALKDYQAANPPDKPLIGRNRNRDSAWVSICQKIEEALMLNSSKLNNEGNL